MEFHPYAVFLPCPKNVTETLFDQRVKAHAQLSQPIRPQKQSQLCITRCNFLVTSHWFNVNCHFVIMTEVVWISIAYCLCLFVCFSFFKKISKKEKTTTTRTNCKTPKLSCCFRPALRLILTKFTKWLLSLIYLIWHWRKTKMLKKGISPQGIHEFFRFWCR